MSHQFYVVDVFATTLYSGNQLAVVVADDNLSAEHMQLIAREMNFSETTFVSNTPNGEGGYTVRIFTPAREIAFAGHPILGTAWVIRQYIYRKRLEPIYLDLNVGRVPVVFELTADGLEIGWFKAPTARLGQVGTPEAATYALGITLSDIDPRTPIQQLSAGVSVLIVPVRGLDALGRCRLDLDKYKTLGALGFAPLVYVFCHETRDPLNHLSARFFFEAHGVREDSATGNGAAFLGTYLLHYDTFRRPELLLRIEQGQEVNRPSLLMLRARMVEGIAEVNVGGHVSASMRGDLVC